MKRIDIITKDHYSLAAHLFEPQISNQKVLLINSATGVKQQIYFSVAQFFADHGFTVITYDYRGIGLSKPHKMRGFEASMRVWGTTDYQALTDYIKSNFDIKFEKYDDRLIRLFIDKVGVDVWQRIKQEYMLELFLYLRVL